MAMFYQRTVCEIAVRRGLEARSGRPIFSERSLSVTVHLLHVNLLPRLPVNGYEWKETHLAIVEINGNGIGGDSEQ